MGVDTILYTFVGCIPLSLPGVHPYSQQIQYDSLLPVASYVLCVDICVCVLAPYMQGANQNAASASGGSVGGERLGSGSEVVSPGSSTLHSHGGGSELREITV